MRRRIFIKQMTPAEAGDTKTHEKYVRLPNNFDYQSFFQQEGITNGSVIQVDFDAAYNGDQNDVIPLKFVYYASSNQEKRIPSLGPIFDKYNVTSSDVVYLESRTENGRTSFSISFKKDSELRIFTSPIVYEIEDVEDDIQKQALALNDFAPNQIIYYGCPGSGKSHKVKEITNTIDSNYVFRTTFHPDTDYASFVGCYKPKGNRTPKTDYTKQQLIEILTDMKDSGLSYPMHRFAVEYYFALEPLSRADREEITLAAGFTAAYLVEMDKSIAAGKHINHIEKENTISYEFAPQIFANAYVKAWEDTRKPVYLIIEEINRGNCAQIFGDLFQLLDRDKATGKSEYPIKADKDLVAHIERVLGAGHEGIKNGELCLPPNLIIYATMNTSDQSLFPMDSAFKRRWDWEYVPIEYGQKKSNNEDNDSYNFIIKIGGNKYKWIKFLRKVNDKIYDTTLSEDKQMGNYFIKGDVDELQFVNKVMFYLWNEVCKEEYKTQRNFFRKGKAKDNEECQEFKFVDLFTAEEGKNIEQTRVDILTQFMAHIEVTPEPKGENSEPKNNEQPAEQ